MIPKIIHQTAPSDIKKWHPIWEECQSSWIENHFNFRYIFWDDNDLRNLIKNYYRDYLNFYDSIELKIVKIDFARFCILHYYGGIYVDMDIYCYKNFYSNLTEKLYILESWSDWGEIVQNSLMASSRNHPFWEKCIKLSKKEIESKKVYPNVESILHACGPKFLSKIIDETVSILPKEYFNPKIINQFNWAKNNYESQFYKNAYSDFQNLNLEKNLVFTRHYLTGKWTYDM